MIEGYQSFEAVGFGGFSTVYLAEQVIFGRRVAVKILHADLRDADAERRFVRECKATGRLSGHPNIITVYDAGTTQDHRPYLAMEYFSGGSLVERLKRDGPLPVPTALALCAPIADALAAAHDQGILHRDLKPANILLRGADDPVLSDFGIASISDGFDAPTVSAAFTPGYAAPEVLLGESPEVAADIFALGATLFTLISGTTPFPGRVPAQILQRIHAGDVTPIPRDDVPPDVRRLLTRMLHARPDQRPPNAKQVRDELGALLLQTGEADTSSAALPLTVGSAAGLAGPIGPQPSPSVGSPSEKTEGRSPLVGSPTLSGSSPTRRSWTRGRALLAAPVVLLTVAVVVLVAVLVNPSDRDRSTGPDGSSNIHLSKDGSAADPLVPAPPTATDLSTSVPVPASNGAGQQPGGVGAPGVPGTVNGGAASDGSANGTGAGQPPVGAGSGAQPGPDSSASAAAPAPAQPPAAASGCPARSATTVDYRGRRWPTSYTCATYVGSALYANVAAGTTAGLDDSGYMNKAAAVWVICQLNGRPNPVLQDNTNTWWLYTEGDSARANDHGYTGAWGYLPATAVTVGGQNEPIAGIPTCSGYL